jgi:hypothetical protein
MPRWTTRQLVTKSATQLARDPDRKRLDDFRAWANAPLARRPPPIVLARTDVDELRRGGVDATL